MPDPVFQILFGETETMRWASPAEVRDRARRRSRRNRIASVTAAAVVALICGGVAVAQRGDTGRPRPGTSVQVSASGSPSPAASPSPAGSAPTSTGSSGSSAEPTALVEALFLQPSDVGTDYRPFATEEGDWGVVFSANYVGCYPTGGHVTPTARRFRGLTRGAPEAQDSMVQYVARYRPGGAAAFFDEVRSWVANCTPNGVGRSIKIVAQGFAGQESLIIQTDLGSGNTIKHILVRQGDVLTEFTNLPGRSTTALKDLGVKAAARLCAGTPVC